VLPQSAKIEGDSKSQSASKSAENQEVTSTQADDSTSPNQPAKVPVDDSTGTKNVSRSDKLSYKPTESDADLAEVVQAWPQLPDAIRSAILTLVRASIEKQEG
jgi:hypothetical protein